MVFDEEIEDKERAVFERMKERAKTLIENAEKRIEPHRGKNRAFPAVLKELKEIKSGLEKTKNKEEVLHAIDMALNALAFLKETTTDQKFAWTARTSEEARQEGETPFLVDKMIHALEKGAETEYEYRRKVEEARKEVEPEPTKREEEPPYKPKPPPPAPTTEEVRQKGETPSSLLERIGRVIVPEKAFRGPLTEQPKPPAPTTEEVRREPTRATTPSTPAGTGGPATPRRGYKGKIVGWVIDEDTSQPLNAKVTAISRTANWSRSINTDDEGHFEIDVPLGIYSVSAKATDYERHTKYGIEVSEFLPVGLHFTLRPSRPRAKKSAPTPVTGQPGRPPSAPPSTGPGGPTPTSGPATPPHGEPPPAPPQERREEGPKKPEIDITAEPRDVIVGRFTTLKWKSKNADEVILYSSPQVFPDRPTIPSGEMRTPPLTSSIAPLPYDVSFMAVARGPGGEAADEVIVHVREKIEKEIIGEEIEKGKVEEYKQSKRIIKRGAPSKKWLAEDILGGKFTTGSLINVIILSVLLSLYYSFTIGRILGLVGLQQTGFLTAIGIIVILLLVFFSTRGKGWGGSIRFLLPFVGIYTVLVIITFFNFANLLDMEWYLARLDILKLVGVPESTVDNVKAGIRNALSFLFKEKPAVEKPVAEKIGSWQALDVKFGSKYRDYKLPTLYANDTLGYILPVTVLNPNTIESGIVIRDFYIISNDKIPNTTIYDRDAGMYTTDRFKLMCGVVDSCSNSRIQGGEKPCEIQPQTEKEILINFKQGEISYNGDCSTTTRGFRLPLQEIFSPEACEKECNKRCMTTLPGSWNKDKRECTCKELTARTKNNFTELCCNTLWEYEIGKEVLVGFLTGFTFSVEGNSEFFVLQKETDVKLLPKPKITTSTGPLGITIWFAPSFYSLDKTTITDIRMFVDVVNKGGGNARIEDHEVIKDGKTVKELDMDMSVPNNPTLSQLFSSCLNTIKTTYAGGKFVINRGEEKEILCGFRTDDIRSLLTVTGTYVTIPINVKMNYTYSQNYGQTIPIYKVEVTKDEDKPFIGLPGYCNKIVV